MDRYITEYNILKSTNNEIFNIGNLNSHPDKNILFITGYPGAGKTTILHEIKTRYRDAVHIISMDYFWIALIKIQEKKWKNSGYRKRIGYLICKYFDTVISKYLHKFSNIRDWEDPVLVKEFKKFLIWLSAESRKSYMSGKIIVIEGTQIPLLDLEYLYNKPLIIIGTSLAKSYIRKAKRDMIPDMDYEHIKRQISMIPVYKKFSKDLNELTRYIRNATDEPNYYRVTYDGDDIYNAFRNRVPTSVWMKFLQLEDVKWLPKPEVYTKINRSYFTKKGYVEFIKLVLPHMITYLDIRDIKVDRYNTVDNIVYNDDFQVVTGN